MEQSPVNGYSALPSREGISALNRVKYRAFDDTLGLRNAVFDSVLTTAKNLQPVQNQKYTLTLSDVDWEDDPSYTRDDIYQARLRRKSLDRRLRGTWNLFDTASGKLIQSQPKVIAHVPYILPNGAIMDGGNQYYIRNQQRLKPGVFVRRKDNGEIVSNVNVLSHEGQTHHYDFNPEKRQFNISVAHNNIPIYSFLRSLGASDEEMSSAWGKEIFSANKYAARGSDYRKIYDRFVRSGNKVSGDTESDDLMMQRIAHQASLISLSPEVTRKTLGRDATVLDKDVVLRSTAKMIALAKGEAEPDSRDDMAFQSVYGPEDLFAERLRLDDGRFRRQLLAKLTFLSKNKPDLSKIPSGYLTRQVRGVLTDSGLASPAEEINPYEQYTKLYSISRLGRGSIGSIDAVPDSARDVNNSQYGFIDPLQTPESMRAGVDLYISSGAVKGSDNNLYIPVINARTGKKEYKSPVDLSSSVVTLKNEWDKRGPMVSAFDRDRQPRMGIDRNEVDYIIPNPQSGFNILSNLVPMLNSVKGQRVAMAARMCTQSLPIVNGESPLVQSKMPDSEQSYEEMIGRFAAVSSDTDGIVKSVSENEVVVQTAKGLKRYPLANYHATNRKTYEHNTPVVQTGDQVRAGQLLAKSNFTDSNGALAQGLNARTVVMPWRGTNVLDGIVVSQSFADRMRSQHAYQHRVDWSPNIKHDKKTFIGSFPGEYSKEQLDTVGDDGVIKVGSKVSKGDPLILKADVNTAPVGRIHRKGAHQLMNSALEWDHHDPGVVTAVYSDDNGVNVVVASEQPMRIADKLAGRYGNKGVITEIVPDEQMPQTPDGPAEVVFDSLGNIGRVNYGMLHEITLGRIAKKLGRPLKIPSFDYSNPDTAAYVLRLAQEHGINPREAVIDPTTGKPISGVDGKGVNFGYAYVQKLHHSAESKSSERSFGRYTSDDMPASGGEDGAKRVALMHTNALISHGAYNLINETRRIRGQKNDEYWAQLMRGYQPPEPSQPAMYSKFISYLEGSGIHVVPKGNRLQILALTNNDVRTLSGDREVTNSETVRWEGDKKGISGGLFDPALFGEYGDRWAYFKPPVSILNPVMEDPARQMLGLTQKQLESVISGRESLGSHGTGFGAVRAALSSLNVEQEMLRARSVIATKRGSERDAAVKRLQYLKSAQANDIHPKDWFLDRIPIVPPKFRPVSEMPGTNTALVADVNYLYKQYIDHANNLKELEREVGVSGDEHLQSYNYFKQIAGLMDPAHPKLVQKRVSGLLKHVFGEESSKYGYVQRSLLGGGVDMVGRNVITIDPNLDMDSVGIPAESAYDIYKPLIIRKLTTSGLSLMDAKRVYDSRDRRAKRALLELTKERPVILDRSPVLHKFGVMALWPQIIKGDTIKMNPYVHGGFGSDVDGNCCDFDSEISIELSKSELRSSDEGKHFLSLLDEHMKTLGTSIIWVNDSTATVRMKIGDIPRIGTPVRDKNGADIYLLPKGISVLTYSPDTGVCFAAATNLTVEESHPCCEVTTSSGKSVIVSDNESLCVYDHTTGGLAKEAPKNAIGLYVPVVRQIPFQDAGSDEDEQTEDGRDIVPVDVSLFAKLSKHLGAARNASKDHMRIYGHLRACLVSKRISRKSLLDILDYFQDVSDSRMSEMRKIAECREIIWETVDKVEDAGVRQVFDFCVPDTKVFAVNDGIIIYDTLNFQVPISSAALDDAVRLMLPSQNLFSPLDNKSPQAVPQENYVFGLYEATRHGSGKGRAKVFATKSDFLRAYAAGEVRVSDEIEILKKNG